LINTEDGYHLWSEKYDRDLEDVFAIQDEIASEIAGKLKSEITGVSSRPDGENRPDTEAYELYLKGRYSFNKFSPVMPNKALETFSEVISIDPDYAPAYAGLADSYMFLANPFGTLENNVAMPKAKSAAEKALQIDSNLSDAYVSLGSIATFHDWDSVKAHQYFDRAIELNGNNVNARIWSEMALSLLDQDFDEALSQLKIAFDLDPLNILILVRMGYVYVYKYEFETAVVYFNKIVDLAPGLAAGYHGLQDAYGLQGKYDLSTEAGEKAFNLGAEAADYLMGALGCYQARSGNKKRANELLNILLKKAESASVSPFWIAAVYQGLNKYDEMFECYEKCIEQHDSNLLYLFVPVFDPIREDPRYIPLRKKMGFEK